jgi:hypothetical protein
MAWFVFGLTTDLWTAINPALLRKETTLLLSANAARVHLGSSKRANARLHEWMKSPRPAKGGGRKTKKK